VPAEGSGPRRARALASGLPVDFGVAGRQEPLAPAACGARFACQAAGL